MPKEVTGWDSETLHRKAPIYASAQLPWELKLCKLKLKTKIGKAKMHARDGEGGTMAWGPKSRKEGGDSAFLGVSKRYATALIIEFQNSSLVSEDNPAMAVLWLGDVPDEE